MSAIWSSILGVIYAHPLRISISTYIRDIELLAKHGEIKGIRNQVIFLPLKHQNLI